MHCYIVPGDGLSGWNRTMNAFLSIDHVLIPNVARHRFCVFVFVLLTRCLNFGWLLVVLLMMLDPGFPLMRSPR